MRLRSKLGILLAALVLGATPALALAAHPNDGKSNGPGPNGKATNPTSACKGLSKKHIKGQKGHAVQRTRVGSGQASEDDVGRRHDHFLHHMTPAGDRNAQADGGSA